MSAVAGIIDRWGGLRVVVTEAERMQYHVGYKEKLFVLPGIDIPEPVPWDNIPVVIRGVELYIDEFLATRNDPDIMRDRTIRRWLKNPNRFKKLLP